MIQRSIIFFFLTGICIGVQCQTLRYAISGRNLPDGKNLFFEIDKDRANKCRSESIEKEQNPEWQKKCEVKYTGDKNLVLKMEIRHDKSGAKDNSIGWGIVSVKNMLEKGKTIQESIWSGDRYFYRGYIRITTEDVC